MNSEYSENEIMALGEQLGSLSTSWEDKDIVAKQLEQIGVRSCDALFYAHTISAKDHYNWILVGELVESTLIAIGESVLEPLKQRIKEDPYSHIPPTVLIKVGGEQVLGTVIEAFRRVCATPSQRILGVFTHDEHRPARLLYIYLISQYDTSEVRVVLKEVAEKDRSSKVRIAAREALENIKNKR